MNKARLLGAVALVVAISIDAPAQGASLAISPSIDTSIHDSNFDGIFDVVGDVTVAERLTLEKSTQLIRAAMEFNLNLIPTGAQINSASLFISAQSWTGSLYPDGSGMGFEVHGYIGDGVITTYDATETNLLGGPYRPSTNYQGSNNFNIDITDFIESLSGQQFAGFRLSIFQETQCIGLCKLDIASSEWTKDVLSRPRITIDYTLATVPLPPALWLFGSGLLGLIGVARKP